MATKLLNARWKTVLRFYRKRPRSLCFSENEKEGKALGEASGCAASIFKSTSRALKRTVAEYEKVITI